MWVIYVLLIDVGDHSSLDGSVCGGVVNGGSLWHRRTIARLMVGEFITSQVTVAWHPLEGDVVGGGEVRQLGPDGDARGI